MTHGVVTQRISSTGYIISCPSCGSTYTAEKVDNCKQCGAPVTYRSQPDTFVHHGGENTPLVITRLPDSPMDYYTEFRAQKIINGVEYGAAVRVDRMMWMMEDRDTIGRFVVDQFRLQMSRTMAEEMEIIIGGNHVW